MSAADQIRVLELETALDESERMRDSLRLELTGLEYVRRKDNEYLLDERDKARGERDAYRVLLKCLVDASDGRPDDPEWLEALYAARNVLRDGGGT